MKGLLKNNFYGITDSLKVVALLLIVLGAVAGGTLLILPAERKCFKVVQV